MGNEIGKICEPICVPTPEFGADDDAPSKQFRVSEASSHPGQNDKGVSSSHHRLGVGMDPAPGEQGRVPHRSWHEDLKGVGSNITKLCQPDAVGNAASQDDLFAAPRIPARSAYGELAGDHLGGIQSAWHEQMPNLGPMRADGGGGMDVNSSFAKGAGTEHGSEGHLGVETQVNPWQKDEASSGESDAHQGAKRDVEGTFFVPFTNENPIRRTPSGRGVSRAGSGGNTVGGKPIMESEPPLVMRKRPSLWACVYPRRHWTNVSLASRMHACEKRHS